MVLQVSYQIFPMHITECGEHGRFEYCIDEIPGCVVGCHCHPGFYFDTESKICESNLKLLEHVPRRNSLTPTRRYTGYTKTPILKNEIDDQVKDIKKGADDLGDWLYNQFFSEVENQVINNTKETDLPSRRMGNKQNANMKSDKKLLERSFRKRKNENLKKKIMRITENDSVFDVSSSNESEKNSDSISDDSDSSNDEHEHKKIVMIKKKAKPLPSFIFLPNMDTQFYPPLGLPPPPVMPMYPMVPVPPVLPMLQMPVPLICDTKASTETTKITTIEITTRKTTTETTTRETTTGTTTRETTTKKTTPMITTEPATPLTTTIGVLRSQEYNKMPEMFPDYPGQEYYVPPPLAPEPIHRQHPRTKLHFKQRNMNSQQNFLQQLKSKNKAHSPYITPINSNNQEIDDMMEPPIIQNPLAEPLYNDEINKIEAPAVDNVDFKYISELIHRVDVNKTKDQKINKLNPLINFDANKYIQRRSRPVPPRIQNKETNFAIKSLENDYYSKIGRQIASLIRNLDKQNKQETIPINQEHNELPKNLYLKENSPTFLWERNVRSPITIMNNKKKFEYLKRSNELLFNLEDKVEIIATTPASLSLQEIENIVNMIEAVRKEIATEERDRIFPKFTPLNNNLNINLWPRELYQTDDKFKPLITSYKSRNINTTILNIKQPVGLNNKKSDNAMITNHLKTGSKIPVWHNIKQNEIELHRLDISDQPYNYLYNSSLSGRMNSKYLSPMLPKQYHHPNKLNPTHLIDIDIFKQFPLHNIDLSFTKRTTFKPERFYYRPTYFPNE